jgi:anaphase-promoting complex subunit 11
VSYILIHDIAGNPLAHLEGNSVPQSCRVHKDKQTRLSNHTMKVIVKQWHAIAQWQWDTGKTDENGDPEEDVCGICRVPFEGCCPTCKVPGDDCPLSRSLLMQTHLPAAADNIPTLRVWGECSHVFHMHCLLKWIATAASKQQCPMDRRLWGAIINSLHSLSFDSRRIQ